MAKEIFITVNGERRCVSSLSTIDHPTIDNLIAQLALTNSRGIALAINQKIIPRDRWGAHALCDGDVVVLIRAAQGG